AQLVGQHRYELVHALRRIGERLRVPALGQVLNDQNESAMPALAVAERRDCVAGPELRAVLANSPAFVPDAVVLPGTDQLVPGLVGGDILGREKLREMAADDRLRRVAENLARSIVPAADQTAVVEHDDRVIADAL